MFIPTPLIFPAPSSSAPHRLASHRPDHSNRPPSSTMAPLPIDPLPNEQPHEEDPYRVYMLRRPAERASSVVPQLPKQPEMADTRLRYRRIPPEAHSGSMGSLGNHFPPRFHFPNRRSLLESLTSDDESASFVVRKKRRDADRDRKKRRKRRARDRDRTSQFHAHPADLPAVATPTFARSDALTAQMHVVQTSCVALSPPDVHEKSTADNSAPSTPVSTSPTTPVHGSPVREPLSAEPVPERQLHIPSADILSETLVDSSPSVEHRQLSSEPAQTVNVLEARLHPTAAHTETVLKRAHLPETRKPVSFDSARRQMSTKSKDASRLVGSLSDHRRPKTRETLSKKLSDFRLIPRPKHHNKSHPKPPLPHQIQQEQRPIPMEAPDGRPISAPSALPSELREAFVLRAEQPIPYNPPPQHLTALSSQPPTYPTSRCVKVERGKPDIPLKPRQPAAIDPPTDVRVETHRPNSVRVARESRDKRTRSVRNVIPALERPRDERPHPSQDPARVSVEQSPVSRDVSSERTPDVDATRHMPREKDLSVSFAHRRLTAEEAAVKPLTAIQKLWQALAFARLPSGKSPARKR